MFSCPMSIRRFSSGIFMTGKGGQAGPAAGAMPAGGGDGTDRSSYLRFRADDSAKRTGRSSVHARRRWGWVVLLI